MRARLPPLPGSRHARPAPGELTHEQGLAFIGRSQVRRPDATLILTGGDPLERRDLLPLIDEARRLGVDVSITPAATDALTGMSWQHWPSMVTGPG